MHQSPGLAPSLVAKVLEERASSPSDADYEPSQIDRLEHSFRNCLYAIRMEVLLLKNSGCNEEQLRDVFDLLENDQAQAEKLLVEIFALLRDSIRES